MIDSLHSLTRNPLPAITALNLRGNRLRSLAGIERLPSLERLDLRDNNLFDPTEIARLTNLPEIREIWVSGNPFVKTHPNYRVVIFNLFRRTPGYSEDIIIDGSGPGYTERKQLADRVAEVESTPVIRSATADHSAVAIVSKPLNVAQGAAASKSSQAPVPENDRGIGSSRRKQGPRRRIVDISSDKPTDDNGDTGAVVPSVSPMQHVHLLVDPFVSTPTDRQWKSDGGPQAEPSNIPHPDGIVDTSSSSQVKTSAVVQNMPHNTDWKADEEFYMRKLEALKQEFGSSWLSTMGDRTRDKSISMPRTGTSIGESNLLTAGTFPRAANQPILSGGNP
jgi:hypothetical protein